jgi:hypothetical protein
MPNSERGKKFHQKLKFYAKFDFGVNQQQKSLGCSAKKELVPEQIKIQTNMTKKQRMRQPGTDVMILKIFSPKN